MFLGYSAREAQVPKGARGGAKRARTQGGWEGLLEVPSCDYPGPPTYLLRIAARHTVHFVVQILLHRREALFREIHTPQFAAQAPHAVVLVTVLLGPWVTGPSPMVLAEAPARAFLLIAPVIGRHKPKVGPQGRRRDRGFCAVGIGRRHRWRRRVYMGGPSLGKPSALTGVCETSRRAYTPCVTCRLVVVPLRGPGQSPVLPFACCVGLLLSASRCGRCSCWSFCVRGAQWLVCWGCAECGMVCGLRVSSAQ